MNLPRTVRPEALDDLPEDDADAMRSRRDLQRVNLVMGARGILVKALAAALGERVPRRVLELGAGDGTLMLRIARTLAPRWPGVELTLLDRQRLVSAETLAKFEAQGWHAKVANVDVLQWAEEPALDDCDVVVTNLFLHHFEGASLASLLLAIAQRAQVLCACEPRRAPLPLVGSRLVGVIGGNAITRADAVLSVHAGFRDKELSLLWPGTPDRWTLREHGAGLFSHCFVACRRTSA